MSVDFIFFVCCYLIGCVHRVSYLAFRTRQVFSSHLPSLRRHRQGGPDHCSAGDAGCRATHDCQASSGKIAGAVFTFKIVSMCFCQECSCPFVFYTCEFTHVSTPQLTKDSLKRLHYERLKSHKSKHTRFVTEKKVEKEKKKKKRKKKKKKKKSSANRRRCAAGPRGSAGIRSAGRLRRCRNGNLRQSPQQGHVLRRNAIKSLFRILTREIMIAVCRLRH